MTFDPNDPKYTTFVLNELDDAERAAVQDELQSNPQAAALVAEIRMATDQIAHALKSEPLPALTEAQREAILVAPASKTAAKSSTSRRRLFWTTAIAASALIVAGAAWLMRRSNDSLAGREIASTDFKLDSEAASQNHASNQMKQIGLGMTNYESNQNSPAPGLQ